MSVFGYDLKPQFSKRDMSLGQASHGDRIDMIYETIAEENKVSDMDLMQMDPRKIKMTTVSTGDLEILLAFFETKADIGGNEVAFMYYLEEEIKRRKEKPGISTPTMLVTAGAATVVLLGILMATGIIPVKKKGRKR